MADEGDGMRCGKAWEGVEREQERGCEKERKQIHMSNRA